MNDEFSYDIPEEKGRKSAILLVTAVLIALGIIVGFFTTYKQETLLCNKSQDACYIQKTNMLNIKRKKFLVKYSQIANITYLSENVKGNAYAKGYSYYLLKFNLKNGNYKIIFSTNYPEFSEITTAINNFKSQKKNNVIILNRK